jgi:hypothetical protein
MGQSPSSRAKAPLDEEDIISAPSGFLRVGGALLSARAARVALPRCADFLCVRLRRDTNSGTSSSSPAQTFGGTPVKCKRAQSGGDFCVLVFVVVRCGCGSLWFVLHVSVVLYVLYVPHLAGI